MSDNEGIVRNETGGEFSPEMIKSATIRKVYDHWLGKCADAPMPSVDSIDILDLQFAIGAISFIDVVDQRPRFLLRMIGSEVVRHHGFDNTGLLVDDIEDEFSRDVLRSSYTRVFEQRAPFWIERKAYTGEYLFVYECLVLPLQNAASEVIQLMSVLDWPKGNTNLPWAEVKAKDPR